MRGFGRPFATAAITVAGVLSVAAPASGAVTCSYDQAADVLTATANANGDTGILSVAAGGEINVFDNVAGQVRDCNTGGGDPTVNNTSDITLTDANVSTSWAVGDPEDFAPGTGGTGEVEVATLLPGANDSFAAFDLDQSSNDFWVLGAMGINWNGDMDVDVTLLGVEQVQLAGGGGNDAITARGQDGTGNPFSGPAMFTADGGFDNDVIEGGDTGDLLSAGPGVDELRGFGGADRLASSTGTNDLQGGEGDDRASYVNSSVGVSVDLGVAGPQNTGIGTDTLGGVEGLEGTNQADVLIGNQDANALIGQAGSDTLDGRGGNDPLDGGAGVDTATYESAPVGVNVDLGAGTATGGAGNDTLTGIDDLIGSPLADTLIGDAANNSMTGLGGNDTVSALAGADTVNVRDGGPDTASCGSEIDSAIADQASVDAVNADCENASFLPEPPSPAPLEPQPKADRTLTLDTNKNKVKKGAKVRFSGRIDAPQDEAGCEPNQTVELQRKAKNAPDSAFATFAALQSDTTGNYATNLKVKKTRVYRAVVAGNESCNGEVSNTKKIRVKKK